MILHDRRKIWKQTKILTKINKKRFYHFHDLEVGFSKMSSSIWKVNFFVNEIFIKPVEEDFQQASQKWT